jgi:hypothetical protein
MQRIKEEMLAGGASCEFKTKKSDKRLAAVGPINDERDSSSVKEEMGCAVLILKGPSIKEECWSHEE